MKLSCKSHQNMVEGQPRKNSGDRTSPWEHVCLDRRMEMGMPKPHYPCGCSLPKLLETLLGDADDTRPEQQVHVHVAWWVLSNLSWGLGSRVIRTQVEEDVEMKTRTSQHVSICVHAFAKFANSLSCRLGNMRVRARTQ